MRLNKYIADAGICSRREADKMIAAGRVRIGGQIAAPGSIVGADDMVCVDGKPVVAGTEEKVVFAFYKPSGYVCTERDRHATKTIYDILDYPQRLTYAGRLDKASEGLLIMTNDGHLIEKMMRARHGHEKEYAVRVDKPITSDVIEKMQAGMYLAELDTHTRPCVVIPRGEDDFTMILTQGVNKQIRRMCSACGLRVRSLKRTRVVNIELGNLQPGEYRRIEGGELEELYSRCHLKPHKSTA